jgi:hypothetical protein
MSKPFVFSELKRREDYKTQCQKGIKRGSVTPQSRRSDDRSQVRLKKSRR